MLEVTQLVGAELGPDFLTPRGRHFPPKPHAPPISWLPYFLLACLRGKHHHLESITSLRIKQEKGNKPERKKTAHDSPALT